MVDSKPVIVFLQTSNSHAKTQDLIVKAYRFHCTFFLPAGATIAAMKSEALALGRASFSDACRCRTPRTVSRPACLALTPSSHCESLAGSDREICVKTRTSSLDKI
jgi:hypothetical protein